MRKTLIAAAMASFVWSGGAQSQGIPTYDNVATINWIKTSIDWKNQLDQMKSQLSQAKQQYTSITGNRGLGSVLYNQELRNNLPPDYRSVYDKASGGNYGISGSISDIVNAEKLTGSISEMQKGIQERSALNAVTDKAVGLKAYEGSQQRLNQLESLMTQINGTQDPKAVAELQARLAVEQAAIQNETTKLQMIAQLQVSEQNLVQEQKRDMNRKLLNSANTGMPGI